MNILINVVESIEANGLIRVLNIPNTVAYGGQWDLKANVNCTLNLTQLSEFYIGNFLKGCPT